MVSSIPGVRPIRKTLLAAALLLVGTLPGCGPDGGGGGGGSPGGGSPPVIPPPPDITIFPGSTTLFVGETIHLTCRLQGAVVPAEWSISNDHIAGVTGAPESATVLGVAAGQAILSARVGESIVHAVMDVVLCNPTQDPGGMVGCDGVTVHWYPPMGGGDRIAFWNTGSISTSKGFTINRAKTHVYALVNRDGAQDLKSYDLSTGTVTTVVSGLVVGAGDIFAYTLSEDREGRIITMTAGGEVLRIDPVEGTVDNRGASLGGSGLLTTTAVGPGDLLFHAPLMTSPHSPWIYRNDLDQSQMEVWSLAPAGAGLNDFVIPGGISFSGTTALVACVVTNNVYRLQDVNADGDALGAGERIRFSTLPFASSFDDLVVGIAATCGGDAAIVNNGNGPGAGTYWIADRDNSGTADSDGEVLLYSPRSLHADFDTGCIKVAQGGIPRPFGAPIDLPPPGGGGAGGAPGGGGGGAAGF